MKVRNALIFPAGTEIGLEIFHALKYCKEVRLFGAGQDVSNHAKLLYEQYYVLPSVHEPLWSEELSKLCNYLQIDYIFPAHDDVVVALSANRERFRATVIGPDTNVCRIARSKSATYSALSRVMRVPKLYPITDQDRYVYPLLVKPDRGQGSYGITKVRNHEELQNAIRSIPEPIVCEYLPGEEFTVDCFSDRERGVLFASARSRRRTRNGISVNTVTEDRPEVLETANKINAVLPMRGAWFFQLKRSETGELTLLEVAPRIAGAMATHRVMGVNFPLLSIFEHERLPLDILLNPGPVELDRALCNRYRHRIEFDSLYIDLDDTILLRGEVNTSLVALVFEAVARGKKVVLLTRHAGDVVATLTRYRLTGLFDEVVHLRNREPKSDYISGTKPILVDDSFSERFEVARRLGIPTFDCSMIEMLLENRR